MVAKKLCPICHEYKLAKEFGPDPKNVTGLSRYCRVCAGGKP